MSKIVMNLPVSVPIFALTYTLHGAVHTINVYPTLQFLYIQSQIIASLPFFQNGARSNSYSVNHT